MSVQSRYARATIAKVVDAWNGRPALTAATVAGAVTSIVLMAWLIAKLVGSGSARNTISEGVLRLTVETTLDATRMPAFRNGTEYGVGLWLYMNEPPRTSASVPLLSFGDAPVFELQPGRADVHVTIPLLEQRRRMRQTHARFDHVSLKRWVHILAVHVDGTLTLFKDGEIYSVDRIGAIARQLGGPVVVGGRPVDAYVAGVTVLNHFPTDRQVDAMYRAGPYSSMSTLFRWLGFTNFGLRSPVYALTE